MIRFIFDYNVKHPLYLEFIYFTIYTDQVVLFPFNQGGISVAIF